MKKIIILIIGLITIAFASSYLSIEVQAATTYNVTFQSMFDDANPGTADSLGAQAYATTINLETNVNGAVSPSGDYVFAFFVLNGVVRNDLPINHSFVINGTLDIIAVYSKAGENAVLFMDSNAKLIGVDYVPDNGNADDSTLTLPDKPGFVVSASAKWSGSTNNITDDTVLILQYDKSTAATFYLTVTDGTGAGTYGYNDVVTVTPNASGTAFSHWEDDMGIILSTESLYKFTMLEDKTVIAKFNETPITDVPRILLSEDLELRAEYRSYISQFYLPSGYSLVEYGMLTLTEDKPIDSVDTSSVYFYRGFKYYAQTNEFVMSIPTGSHYSIRAYLVVKDSEGVIHRYYSERNQQYNLLGPVNLRTAYDFTILSKAGISTTGSTLITGDIGVSPIARTALTGFSEVMDGSGEFSTSIYVAGSLYAADYSGATPSMLTTAISDMETAYTDAMSRTQDSDKLNLYSGDISNQTLVPGVYEWTTTLSINGNVTLEGSPTDTWIFQVIGDLTQGANTTIYLSGGAVAENIVWVVSGRVDIGSNSHFEGTILCATVVNLLSGASFNGRILSHTAVTLNGNKIN